MITRQILKCYFSVSRLTEMNPSKVPATTTGSFQNQPTPGQTTATCPQRKVTRKRGVSTLLQDTTNTARIRQTKASAQAKIRESQKMKRPRGDSSLGAQNKWSNKGVVDHSASITSDTGTSSSEKQSGITLRQLVKDHEAFSHGCEYLGEYVERNTSHELSKALSIRVCQTAITMWGEGILEATQRAADVSGNTAATVHRWLTEYHTSLIGIHSSEIDDDMVESILSSNRGRSVRNPHSLILNTEFCIEARQYVRDNANKSDC